MNSTRNRITKRQQITLYEKWRLTNQIDTYLTFRRRVQSAIGWDDAIIVPWHGMWLCIETDGYCHT
mgnify:CR=1 FL=1